MPETGERERIHSEDETSEQQRSSGTGSTNVTHVDGLSLLRSIGRSLDYGHLLET